MSTARSTNARTRAGSLRAEGTTTCTGVGGGSSVGQTARRRPSASSAATWYRAPG